MSVTPSQPEPRPSDQGPPGPSSHDELKPMLERMARQLERSGTPHYLDVWATILLALIGCASAWSVYQATRWSGVMAARYAEANDLRTQGMRTGNAANRQTLVDVMAFIQWFQTTESGQQARAQVLESRFPPALKVALQAWLERAPRSPGALLPQGTPFDMEEYRLANAAKSDQLFNAAKDQDHQAKRANQIGDNFILTIVLYSTALLFVAVGTKSTSVRGQVFLLGLGTLLFILSIAVALSLPQNIGVGPTS